MSCSWPPLTSCLCGPTSWLAPSTPPGQFLSCHCSKCRAQSGGTFVPFVGVPRAAVRLATERLSTFRSSDLASRLFCSTCGAFVAMDYSEEHTVWLALGSVDKFPAGWRLVEGRDSQIFRENKVSWAGEVCALSHRERWGTYRPDPCAPGRGEADPCAPGSGEAEQIDDDENLMQRLAKVATHKADES